MRERETKKAVGTGERKSSVWERSANGVLRWFFPPPLQLTHLSSPFTAAGLLRVGYSSAEATLEQSERGIFSYTCTACQLINCWQDVFFFLSL